MRVNFISTIKKTRENSTFCKNIRLENRMNNQVLSKTTCRVARIYFASELVKEYKNAIVYISSNSKQQQ